ncbi:hypothetical protein HAX54_033193 [Datura stramonium]|uniref:Uncharacterized protein n=1 Tax=Datura stramonium TaxID=4076 RepID=A0ABS8VCL0_DATST|nr:hypothetical protein [Datura stramonium]
MVKNYLFTQFLRQHGIKDVEADYPVTISRILDEEDDKYGTTTGAMTVDGIENANDQDFAPYNDDDP